MSVVYGHVTSFVLVEKNTPRLFLLSKVRIDKLSIFVHALFVSSLSLSLSLSLLCVYKEGEVFCPKVRVLIVLITRYHLLFAT